MGGPTGINADRSTRRLLTFRYVGNAVGVGQVLPSRTATAYGMPDADLLYATGVAAWGDSGGPVLSSDGRAVGVVSGVGLNAREVGTEAVHAGTVRVTRLLPQLRRAERVLGIRLRLHTAHR